MTIDQGHEEANKVIRGDVGAIGMGIHQLIEVVATQPFCCILRSSIPRESRQSV